VNAVPDILVLTLDPDYVSNTRTKYLFIAPGYGYRGDAVPGAINAGVFGNYANYDAVIDGVPFFSNYGPLGNGF
jgi:hypothetical protein